MSDREAPEPGSLPGPGEKKFDALERLRRKLDGTKAADPDAGEPTEGMSKVTRLPRRPRRITGQADERPHKTWLSDGGSVYDPAPTRPVLRSELQRETGWWPLDPGATRHHVPDGDPGGAVNDGTVVDLDALRRRRAGEGGPAGGIRRMAKPRRISKNPGEKSGTDSTPTEGPAEQE
ncbi:hypothetical protein ACWDYH_37535 [Nocardia goodfellowii]